MAELVLGVDGKLILVNGNLVTPPSLDGGLQNKNVTPTTKTQIITADEPYLGLDSVAVGAIQTETKTVSPTTSVQTITPTSGKYLSKVTVNEIYAIIAVTYPEGSICTCSSDNITFTAKDTSGRALFNVPEGEWMVSCTDENRMASQTVSITTDGQSESVELSYSLHLFELGVGLANGYSMKAWNGGTFDENGLVFSSTNIRANIRPAIDLSEYKSMSVTYTYKMNSFGNGPGRIGFHSSSDYMSYEAYTNNNNFPASVKMTANVTNKKVSLDISSLSGNYYFAIHTFDSTTFNITDIELFP